MIKIGTKVKCLSGFAKGFTGTVIGYHIRVKGIAVEFSDEFQYGHNGINECVDEFGNKVKVNTNNCYYYRENNLEVLKMYNEFSLKDLRTGMKVTYRNGIERFVFLNYCKNNLFNNEEKPIDVLLNNNGIALLSSYNDNLTHKNISKYDIVKIGLCKGNIMDICSTYETIWERKDVEEMTLADVCKLLGKEIKIIK